MERLSDKLISWASLLEEQTRQQALRTAQMPFVHPHVALMPDAHLGKGATVGTSSRSATSCGRSSTSRATDAGPVRLGGVGGER